MKKLFAFALIALGVLSFTSCDMDDDGPSISYQGLEITNADLPDFFELDESYDIEVDYILPNACYDFYTFDVKEGRDEENDSTYIVEVAAVGSFDPAITECTEGEDEVEDSATLEDIELDDSKFDEYNTIQFHFLTGTDSNNEPEYLTIDVPIGAPDDEDGENDENENGDDENDENNDDSNE